MGKSENYFGGGGGGTTADLGSKLLEKFNQMS